MWNHSVCYCECDEVGKIDEYLYITKCLYKKLLIGKPVLACQDEMLNT